MGALIAAAVTITAIGTRVPDVAKLPLGGWLAKKASRSPWLSASIEGPGSSHTPSPHGGAR
jgi:hypothetical protein